MARRLNSNTLVPGQTHTPATAEFWNTPLASVISASDGLTQQQAEQRRVQYGPNVLEASPPRALVLQFMTRLGNLLVVMLLAASGIAALTGDTVSFVIISIIVLLGVSLDLVQEYQAGRAAAIIRRLATQVLVIFVIRTRHSPWRSRPNPWLAIISIIVVIVAVLLPLTPIAGYLGFVTPPPLFFALLMVLTLCYLGAAEWAKRRFYQHHHLY